MARNERELMQGAIDVARRFGWLVYHTHDSRRSEPGFPDLIMIKGARMLVIEMKSGAAKPTQAQSLWLDAFRAVERIDVDVVREANLSDLYRRLAG